MITYNCTSSTISLGREVTSRVFYREEAPRIRLLPSPWLQGQVIQQTERNISLNIENSDISSNTLSRKTFHQISKEELEVLREKYESRSGFLIKYFKVPLRTTNNTVQTIDTFAVMFFDELSKLKEVNFYKDNELFITESLNSFGIVEMLINKETRSVEKVFAPNFKLTPSCEEIHLIGLCILSEGSFYGEDLSGRKQHNYFKIMELPNAELYSLQGTDCYLLADRFESECRLLARLQIQQKISPENLKALDIPPRTPENSAPNRDSTLSCCGII